MRNTYKATLIDRYSAEERIERIEAINEEHARRIAGSRCEVCEYVADITLEQPADLVSVSDLADDLNTGDHGDVLCDYRDSDTCISDAIWEAADQRTSIYYSDILAFISEHPEALAEVIEEGLYDPSHEYDLFKHGQAAEFMMIERDLWNHLPDNLMRAALCFIRYDLKRQHIPADLADQLRVWCNTAYQDEAMRDIPDRIREYFAELEGGSDDE